MKLDVKAFGLALGIIWGFGVFFATWWVIALDGASGTTTWLGHIYRGYNITALGSLIGLAWGFFDGLIGGVLFAWLYNMLRSEKAA